MNEVMAKAGAGRKRKKIRITYTKVMLYVIMFALVAFTALPIIYMISTAFKPIDELFLWPPRFLVRAPTLQNFTDLVMSLSSSAVPFTRYMFNSIVNTVTIVTLSVIICSMAAYGIVKHNPPGSKLIFNIVIAAMMFSPHVTRIPSYMVINKLRLIDTYAALILPSIAVAYNMFLVKQFLEQLPNDLLEAARIDGAGELLIYFRIVMPCIKPAWTTLIVFSFVNNWNDYFSPLIYITKQSMKTLPLALQSIGGGAGMSIGRAGAVAAATFLMTIPTIIVFSVMQKKVMETMVHSGIKG